MSEPEVLSGHDHSRAEVADKELLGEVLRRQCRQSVVERNDAHMVGPCIAQQSHPVLQRGQATRRGIGAHDCHRMRIEGEYGQRQVRGVRLLAGDGQQGAVAAVHAVEHPYGDRCRTTRACAGGAVGDEFWLLHGASSVADGPTGTTKWCFHRP